jgi:hypothetical protein
MTSQRLLVVACDAGCASEVGGRVLSELERMLVEAGIRPALVNPGDVYPVACRSAARISSANRPRLA